MAFESEIPRMGAGDRASEMEGLNRSGSVKLFLGHDNLKKLKKPCNHFRGALGPQN